MEINDDGDTSVESLRDKVRLLDKKIKDAYLDYLASETQWFEHTDKLFQENKELRRLVEDAFCEGFGYKLGDYYSRNRAMKSFKGSRTSDELMSINCRFNGGKAR